MASFSQSRPGNGVAMYTYRLHLHDGSDAGTATYAVLVKTGEEILVGNAAASAYAMSSRSRRRASRRSWGC
jgi:hypothetical protein